MTLSVHCVTSEEADMSAKRMKLHTDEEIANKRGKQWRIQDFPDGGAPTPEGGAPTYYLTNFSQKLHENEENLTQRGGRASLRPPPRSANGKYTPTATVRSNKNANAIMLKYLEELGVENNDYTHYPAETDQSSEGVASNQQSNDDDDYLYSKATLENIRMH